MAQSIAGNTGGVKIIKRKGRRESDRIISYGNFPNKEEKKGAAFS
jgi:hypothetical protein